MIQLYESLGMKNEYCTLLKNYSVMIFQAGDFTKIRQLFIKYGLIDIYKGKIDTTDSIHSLISYLDKSDGIDPALLQ